MKHIKKIAVLASLIVVAVIAYATLSHNKTDAPSSAVTQPVNAPTFDKQQYSISDPASVWNIINKQRALPASYAPADLVNVGDQQLRSVAANDLAMLIRDASAQNVPLKGISGYRSYSKQDNLYNSYVARDGITQADTYSARPGYSEHQSGLAIDLGNVDSTCDLETCFANTPGGIWLAAHAYEYGFIIRYASDKTAVTGYQYEPWHIRYVGKELANELHTKKQTMEEYFGFPAAPSY